MSGIIPFARESWVAVNLYSLQTDGRQTLTLDGEPPPNYTAKNTVAYLDEWEHGPEDFGLGGTFYCIKSNNSAPPDMVTTLLDALNARGSGRWLRVGAPPGERTHPRAMGRRGPAPQRRPPHVHLRRRCDRRPPLGALRVRRRNIRSHLIPASTHASIGYMHFLSFHALDPSGVHGRCFCYGDGPMRRTCT